MVLAVPAGLLGLAERLDLLHFFGRELARNLPPRHLLGLNLVAYTVNDLRVRQRGDVSDIGEVGDPSDHPPHDLSGAGLRHVWDDPDVLRSRDLPDLRLDRLGHLLGLNLVAYTVNDLRVQT